MEQDKVCSWCLSTPLYRSYHDEEWGVPSFDDQHLFEMLILEGNQAGLSWSTILNKRENFRLAFDQFDPEKMAIYDEDKYSSLLQDAGIIRNKLKIKAAITNAQAYLDLRASGTSFSDFLWSVQGGKVQVNTYKKLEDVPVNTAISDNLSKQLKKAGFKFVGTTIMYAFMQATGMVNDHIVSCPRHQACIDLIPSHAI